MWGTFGWGASHLPLRWLCTGTDFLQQLGFVRGAEVQQGGGGASCGASTLAQAGVPIQTLTFLAPLLPVTLRPHPSIQVMPVWERQR